jgi:hypothetical protein
MSEQPVSAPAAPPKKAASGKGLTKKVGPLPVWGWAVLGLGGAVAYLWWRSRKSGSASSATTASTTASSAYASSLDQMQEELDQLLAEQSASSAGTGSTGASGSGGTTGTSSGGGTTTKTTSGTTVKTTSPTTHVPTSTTTAPARKPAAPHGVVADKVTSTGATLHWDATGSVLSQTGETYRWRLQQGGKNIRTGVKTSGDLGIGSLKPKTKYDFGVAAVNSAGQSPWASVSFTTK